MAQVVCIDDCCGGDPVRQQQCSHLHTCLLMQEVCMEVNHNHPYKQVYSTI